jgi:CRISPR-associated protein Csa2
MPLFFSLSARILVNLEALNMAESVGNVVRHRRAPVILRRSDGFALRYVPVISGESLAHHYQRLLADIASSRGIPVCSACKQGVFLKHADSNVFKKYDGIDKPKNVFENAAEVEKYVVENCVVEDVGGFLFTDMTVKRTSRFRVGYMIPALDALEAGAAATEAQFHVRYSPGAKGGEQAIYYVEVGSAAYVFTYALDASAVGAYSTENEGVPQDNPYILDLDERRKRVEAALDALAALLGGMTWGAKTTRFQPHWKILSLVAAVTEPLPFNVSPGHGKEYLAETVARACKLSSMIKEFAASIHYYDGEGLQEPEKCASNTVGSTMHGSYLDAIEAAKKEILEKLA